MTALLNIDRNPKTVKGQTKGYMTAILYLAPWKASGYNVCPMAEIAGCWHPCLNTSGQGGMAVGNAVMAPYGVTVPDNAVQAARIRKTREYFENRDAFMTQLVNEVHAFARKAARKGLTPVVRLNGTSDIKWEHVPADGAPNIMSVFPKIQHYDYTKIANRRNLPPNYHLTFSASGTPGYAKFMQLAIDSGMNLTAVFRKTLPATFMGRPVINGDESDLRFLDPSGVVVGLTAKGRAKKDTSGFVFDA